LSRDAFSPPDAMPLREALRGLRFLLRRGGETIVETMNVEALPKPASDLASAVLREAGGLARTVDEMTSGVAKTVLGGQKSPSAPLKDMIGGPNAGAEFAVAVYVALSTVLRHLGAPTVLVSEAAARSAFGNLAPITAETSVEKRAADLTFCLLAARVMRGTTAQEAALVPGAALEAASIFAVMLWLQSARSQDENEAALAAATDMAVALAPEISRAVAENDVNRIEELYRRYVPHV